MRGGFGCVRHGDGAAAGNDSVLLNKARER